VTTREQIISEIRRCAEENGGTPPGRDRFARTTGIAQSYWEGRYWARWSDALADAGYGPNPWNEALGDDLLLGALAGLVRDLGHYPTTAEVRLARTSDPSFPSHNTFARLGGKADVAARLVEFAERNDMPDVAAIARPEASPPSSTIDVEPIASQGVVYLMRSAKHYKIGHTRALGRREYELAIQLPERLKLVHSIETDDPPGIEAYWHRRFEEKRANGEWFALLPEDVRAFKRRTFM